MNYQIDLLELVREAIKRDLGRLDDIPRELANTVANIYYRFFTMTSEIRPERMPGQIKRVADIRQGLSEFIEESARLLADVEAIPKAIQALRKIEKDKQPNLYAFTVAYLLDEFKYNIKNAAFKPEIWRKIERLFKKHKVKEIPNLIDLMGFRFEPYEGKERGKIEPLINQQASIENDKDGTKMVLIPAGEFLAGEAEKFKVYLPSFFIAIHPVTNAQYAHFLSEVEPSAMDLKEWIFLDRITPCYVRRVGKNYKAYDDMEDHPVVSVTWYGAQAYCEWAGLRLPRELEWEKGARGLDGRNYPWGNKWQEGHCCWSAEKKKDWELPTCSVWSYPEGRSPWGLYQMVGNVNEWCEDWYDIRAYERYKQGDLTPPQKPPKPEFKTILFVYHESTIRSIFKEELEDKGYRVLVASTGKEALEILGLKKELEGEVYRVMPLSPPEISKRHPVVELVISDIGHKEIDGIELLQLIKERWPDLPFFFYTDKLDLKEDFVTRGADEYLDISSNALLPFVINYLGIGQVRVVRGGSHIYLGPEILRCGYRNYLHPKRANNCTGFRCAKTA